MREIALVVIFFLVHRTTGLKAISNSNFSRFPAIYESDQFTSCLLEDGGVFCTAYADLYSDQPNELLTQMREFSSTFRHYNYSKTVRAFCLTRRCKKYYTGNLTSYQDVMDACLNDHFSKEYDMKAIITNLKCYRKEDEHVADSTDKMAIAIILFIITLNVVGCVSETFNKSGKKGFLSCFSIKDNWKQLNAPWPKDPRSERLIGINGMRVITSVLVVMFHTLMMKTTSLENVHYLETSFETWAKQPLLHGQVMMQTFFFLSGMFLAYSGYNNGKLQSWKTYLKAILKRWLRLTPVSSVVLMIAATLMRFAPMGPLKQHFVENEVEDCRQHWIYYIIGVNNYVKISNCGIHNWSNAVDFQFHIIGTAILVFASSKAVRTRLFWMLFIIGVASMGIETYRRDLLGASLGVPEITRRLSFPFEPTIRYLYSTTHTNTPCFVMGMAMGCFVYERLKKPITRDDQIYYQKYTFLYWCLFPLMLLVLASAALLIINEDPAPMSIRLAIALIRVPLWGLLVGLLILGLIFRVESVPVYRSILELHFWVPLAKLSFCVYAVHMYVIRWLEAEKTVPTYLSLFSAIVTVLGITAICYVLSTILWLLVEAPVSNLIKMALDNKSPKEDKPENEIREEKDKLQ